MDNYVKKQKSIYKKLEKIRADHQCPNHKNGCISIVYSAKHKSWIYSCEEPVVKGNTPRSDGKCFWHGHFDPADWEDE